MRLRRGDRRIGEIRELFDAGQALSALGRPAEALASQQRAAALVRELVAEEPDEPLYRRQLAAVLYGMAGSLTATGQPREAIAALDECETLYTALDGQLRDVDTGPLLTDVRVRRGVAQYSRGYIASAVIDLEAGVYEYHALSLQPGGERYEPDFARVLALNAQALLEGGDADLACASADAAVRIFLRLAPQINAGPTAPVYAGYLRDAASTAALIHARQGRLDVAVQAADICVQTARAFVELGAGDAEASLAQALTRLGLILELAGRANESEAFLAEAQAVDAATTVQTEADWDHRDTGDDPAVRTLETALAEAADELGHAHVPADVRGLLRAPQGPALTVTPSGRCGSEDVLRMAGGLANLAVDLLPARPVPAVQLGLHAHYLFAAGSEAQVTDMRYSFADAGTPWARALLAMSRSCHDRGEDALALDLAGWAGGVADALLPYTVTQPMLRTLAADCLQHLGELLLASGDQARGEAVSRRAREMR
ncbi:hypothetical protein AB0K80_29005 [Streptomyces sp. NPDC052682]|uniref:hypothetical protein n=1 Tax=Streptomyces sp. NPDC052682 TaxID=3154954 RepID=UPI003447671C